MGDGITFAGGNAQLSGSAVRATAGHPAGSELTVGFRPEHLELANGHAGPSMRIPAKVDVVEYLGNEELIHAQVDGKDIVALMAADRRVQVGDTIDFVVPIEKLHIFDPTSEARLSDLLTLPDLPAGPNRSLSPFLIPCPAGGHKSPVPREWSGSARRWDAVGARAHVPPSGRSGGSGDGQRWRRSARRPG